MENGIIYCYQLNAPGEIEDGWLYIGQTADEIHRRANWKNTTTPYAGTKLEAARHNFGVDCWTYSIIKTISARTSDELKKILKQEEARFIRKFGSDTKGFNTRAVEKVIVIHDDGSEEEYSSVYEAAIANGLFPGSVYYSDRNDSATRKDGFRFKIN